MAPALIVQSQEDPWSTRRDGRIFQQLGSTEKQYLVFNLKRHGILLGEGSLGVHRAIGDFVDRLFTPSKSGSAWLWPAI